jgi:hypothetical protein
MKRLILKIVASLVFLIALLNIAPSLFQNTNLAGVKLNSLSMGHSSYFRRGQWLADGRTLIAAIRFLCQVRSADSGSPDAQSPIRNVNFPVVPPAQNRLSTNLFVADDPEPTILLQERRLSRVENLIVRNRMLPSYGPSPVFADADSSFDGPTGVLSLDREAKSPAVPVRTALF